MTAHLRLVSPTQPNFPFEAELFAFAKIGADVFVCHKGEWNLASADLPAANALLRWTSAIHDQSVSSAEVVFAADGPACGFSLPQARESQAGTFSTGDEPVLRWPLKSRGHR